jgi:phosphoribosyl 1,2-cyclic phosphodiesterase
MSLYITSINSGSNGNCYYVGNDNEAVLVDAGFSCREIERRMMRCGLSMQKVKALFISHEHTDHIKGVDVIARKYKLPVYFTSATYKNCGFLLDPSLLCFFKPYESVTIGSLKVHAFPKQHDASDPHSFVIEGHGVRIGVFTDIGTVCAHVIQNFKLCHAVFLEANYDVKMLEEGRYPYSLKNRIRGDFGHLSNDQALWLFTEYKPLGMTHVFLSHLSKDNNCPVLVQDLFQQHAGKTTIGIASRYNEMPVYKIQATVTKNSKQVLKVPGRQMSLF